MHQISSNATQKVLSLANLLSLLHMLTRKAKGRKPLIDYS
jgi:hypothetical protein